MWKESRNVGHDGRAALLPFEAVGFAVISRLEAENAALRRQLIVLQRKVRGRSNSRTAIARSSSKPDAPLATVTTAADLFITRPPYFSLNQAPPVRSSFG
jgi:hypothetical protein